MSDDLDRTLREHLGDLRLPPAPGSLHDAVDRLGAEPPGRPQPRWRVAPRAVSVLAAALVVVAVVTWGSGLRLGASPAATPSESAGGTAGPSAATSPTASPGLPTANPRPSGSIVPWLDQSALTAPSPTPAPVPSGTPDCLPGDLTASAGWQGGGGQMLGSLAVTNVGAHPCVLVGSPRLVELRTATATVRPITYHADPGDGSNVPGAVAGPVLLEPGGKAGAYLWWSNWCGTAPVVTSLLVTLPSGGAPVHAGPTSPGPGIGSVPRCDVPSAPSTFTAYAFTPVAPEQPASSPQPASAALSVPSSATPGADLVYYVTLTNLGTQPAPLDPCPTYSENLVAGGAAVKLPAAAFLLLNCAAIGPALAPGASVTLEIRLPIPAKVEPGPAILHWDLDPGGPLDTSSASPQAALAIVVPPTTMEVLLTFEGSGSKSSGPFTASGDSVTLAYTYDCSGPGSSGRFDAALYDRNGVAITLVGGSAMSGGDTAPEYISNTAPPYHVEVNSDCAWAISVTGTP
jgi:hypothetical protein